MTATATAPSNGPLAGRRVLELCSTVAGPACARMLADYGAEVIKIEPLEGDMVRQMGLHEGEISLYAASILRNKRSVALDLRSEEGRALARAIASHCDIVVENFRPGKLEAMGLGYDVLSRDNPGVVLVRISGYGQTGPNSYKPGYGTICEAYGGLRHLTGEPDQVPARMSVALTDYLAAVYAAFGAALALLDRDRSGQGQVIDVSLFEAAFSMLEPDVPAYDRLGIVANRIGTRAPGLAPNNLYLTRDGNHVLIAANNDAIFARLCRAMQRPDLAADSRFASVRSRVAHYTVIDEEVGRWTAAHDSAEIVRLLDEASVPGSLSYTVADAFADQHFHARGAIVRHPHPELGQIAMTGLVAKLSRTPGGVRHTGHEVGQDTCEVLRDLLGLDEERIDGLLAGGVACPAAWADDAAYPSRPLKLIVPYAPGGGTDVTARRFAEQLGRRLGQPVVVDNRPGAATNIGGQALVSASPDGYTVMFGTNQMIINSAFGPKPPFDPVNGFATVALVAEVPYVLAVKADSPARHVKDLLAAGAKAGLTVSHAQFDPQLKLMAKALAAPVLGIPYQGGGPAMTAVLSGEVPTVFAGVSAATTLVKGGQLRLVGVTSSRRISAFPDVPTFVEQGYPEFVTAGWYSLLAPKGTPEAVLRRLGEATLAVARDPAFGETLRANGAEPLAAGAGEAAARMGAELATWTRMAR